MKKISIFIILIAISGLNEVRSQWNFSGTHIYNINTGNVGIGNSSPVTLLHVAKNMTEPTITVQNLGGAGGATYTMIDNGSGANWKFKATLNGGFKIRDHANLLDVITIESNSFANAIYIKSEGNLGIGTSTPDNSALVEMSSTTKGFLPPRMTNAELNAISNPADGLLVFCTDCGSNGSGALSMFMAGEWYALSINCVNPQPPAEGVHVANSNTIFWNWYPVAGATGYRWNINDDYASAQDLGTNTVRMEVGLPCNTSFTRYVWAYNNCGHSISTTLTKSTTLDPPAAPVAGVHVASSTQVEWKWLAVYGATSYRWNTVNDSIGAIDIGNVTSFTETGLTCNTPQTCYVWAIGPCGTSVSTSLSKATLPDPPYAPTTRPHGAYVDSIRWKWNAVTVATSYRWNTINDSIGATNIGNVTSFTETGLTCNTPQTCYVWAVGPCGVSVVTILSKSTLPDPPPTPTAGDHIATPTQIEWKWFAVSGATSYRWNTINDSIGATNIGNVTSFTETGLTCNTAQTSYIWAIGPCGVSVVTTLSESTSLAPPAAPAPRPHVATPTTILWKWTAVTGATSYRWNTIYDSINSTDIGNVINFNETGLACNTPQTSYIWAVGSCGISVVTIMSKSTLPDTPAAPVSGDHIATPIQIGWNWLAVSGATSYRWNTVNDSIGATDIGNVTSLTETGLTCNTPQTSYVWAVGPCGTSVSTALSESTLLDPPAAPAPRPHVATPTTILWKWTAVAGATSYRWNTIYDSISSTDIGNVINFNETGLTCNTPQTSYIWAVGPCGISVVTIMSKSTLPDPPAEPVAGDHIATPTQIVWKWLVVSGATSYRWNSINDSTNAIDIGNVTSRTETGLACNTPQTSYIWAVGTCGNSVVTILSKSTLPAPPPAPTADVHVAASTQIVWKWLVVSGATSYRWNSVNDSTNATDIGNVTSRTETGLTCNSPQTSYVWSVGPCGNSVATVLSSSTLPAPPASPTAGVHIATASQIEWKWVAVSGATSYRWNTINDSVNATNLGNVTSHTETGLACNTPQTCYVWAVGPCGVSVSSILSKSTLDCWNCGNPITINHVAGTVAPVNKTTTYGTVTNIPGETSKCWITSNLGADNQASAVSDATEESAGWYWQFNRKQGYKHDGGTRTPNTTWIIYIDEDFNWQTTNDPCALELGSGWRLPTNSEWTNVDGIGIWNDWNGPWNSALKIHAAGSLRYSNGSLDYRGSRGYYWSSSQNDSGYGWHLNFTSVNCVMGDWLKAYGMTVRCILDI